MLTGNPVRAVILAAAKGERPVHEVPTLLVLGGSQGAHRVNLLMLEAAEVLVAGGRPVRIIHQTGTADEATVREDTGGSGSRPRCRPSFVTWPGSIGGPIWRCPGPAHTLAELAVMGLPALLVPYPRPTTTS